MKYEIMYSMRKGFHRCNGVLILIRTSEDYSRPYWIVSDDKNNTILGCYDSYAKAVKVLNEIFEKKADSDGIVRYRMPKNREV